VRGTWATANGHIAHYWWAKSTKYLPMDFHMTILAQKDNIPTVINSSIGYCYNMVPMIKNVCAGLANKAERFFPPSSIERCIKLIANFFVILLI
jgi:hypothetical protein